MKSVGEFLVALEVLFGLLILALLQFSSSIHFTAYQKHYPPASDDEIWRLESIAKDGPFHKRLNEAGIHKVEEFLRQLSKDSDKLRNTLGMTEKKWKALLDHAKTCTPNGKLYVYHDDSEIDHGVIFNNLGQLSGVTANGGYFAADRFPFQWKVTGKF
ncbi:uncharacterized protein J3R85_010589 [Psidium guajava]|nr:uncharacterized protein J3R85_010589 [Psidium guajava]